VISIYLAPGDEPLARLSESFKVQGSDRVFPASAYVAIRRDGCQALVVSVEAYNAEAVERFAQELLKAVEFSRRASANSTAPVRVETTGSAVTQQDGAA
jgi:hypothetical protein